jgi:hypothetical protein
VLKAN